jgi:hypothetical protein
VSASSGTNCNHRLAIGNGFRYNIIVTRESEIELTWIGKKNRPVFGGLFTTWAVESGQKKRATLSDHPIAIARSCNTYRPFGLKNQVFFCRVVFKTGIFCS